MSFSGSFTPLALNVVGELNNDSGFEINSDARGYQGTWSPGSYSVGSLANVALTTTIRSVYEAIQGSTTDVTVTTYRKLITIGSTKVPALGNSRPESFKPTYPGYGSWQSGIMRSDSYPPKNYPIENTYSYIHQAHGDYSWITGWPGRNSWQKTSDEYKACHLPVSGDPLSDYDEYFSNGFIGTVARQAYYEMWSGQFDQYHNIVNSFQQTAAYRSQQNINVASYVNTKTFMSGMYSNINDITTSDVAGVTQSFKIWGTDLINTGRTIYLPDISKFGLPSALLRNLYRNNSVTDAVKLALHLYGELSITELNEIFNTNVVPTSDQERKIYYAFTLIRDVDLYGTSGVLYGLNCLTENIETLADLLNPKKLFPNSYKSLTLPRYSMVTASAKIYDFIYINDGANTRIQNWGEYLDGILPRDLAISCGAFAMTMQQIKHISSMDVQKFSQSVSNLELTNLNLPLVNANPSTPGSISVANKMLSRIALGSGNNNSYRQCDFFGAASGYPYTDFFEFAKNLLNQASSSTLENIYKNMSLLDLTVIGVDNDLDSLISQANSEISNIYSKNSELCKELNYYWDRIGEQMSIEQRAIPLANPNATDIISQTHDLDFPQFTAQIESYALDTADGQTAPVLERISDTSVLGGQSIVAMMREARNANRLGLAGGDLQNDVSSKIDTNAASAVATIVDGKIASVKVTNKGSGYINKKDDSGKYKGPNAGFSDVNRGAVSRHQSDSKNDNNGGFFGRLKSKRKDPRTNSTTNSGYTDVLVPRITVYPVGKGAKLTPVIASDGSISSIIVEDGGSGYESAEIEISPPPQSSQSTPGQLTYADSPFKHIVPPALIAPATASPDVAAAIDDVTVCNCDCWV